MLSCRCIAAVLAEFVLTIVNFARGTTQQQDCTGQSIAASKVAWALPKLLLPWLTISPGWSIECCVTARNTSKKESPNAKSNSASSASNEAKSLDMQLLSV